MSNRGEILLVEDNTADVKLALNALGKGTTGPKVTVVRDGQEALDFLFYRGKYVNRSLVPLKFILLDLKLPKINGFEVLQTIKTQASTQAIPVIVFSSSNQDRDLRESYRLGANSYVQKPVDFDRFTELIAEIKQYWLSVNYAPPAPEGDLEQRTEDRNALGTQKF